MNNFCRKLRLTEFFHDEEINNEDLVKPSSSWIPERGRNEALDISIEYLQSLVKYDSKNTYNKKSNISKDEKKGIENLSNNKDIIIKEADKGSAVVIMNRLFYKEKMEQMLNDTSTYKRLARNQDEKSKN